MIQQPNREQLFLHFSIVKLQAAGLEENGYAECPKTDKLGGRCGVDN